MASSSTSTSTPHTVNNDYVFDVFINHRGPDVKKTLATDLYHRLCKHDLRVFLDERELRVGENLTPQIESAIRTSSVNIAIFSRKYAYSKWCLDELVLMVDCMSKYKSTIIPVFYGVKPTELRWLEGGKGVYAKALSKLQEKKDVDGGPRYDSNTLKKWKKALSDVPEIIGFDGEKYNRKMKPLSLQLVSIVASKKLTQKLPGKFAICFMFNNNASMRVTDSHLWARTEAFKAKWPSPRDTWAEGSRSRPASLNCSSSIADNGLIGRGSGSMLREVHLAVGRSSGSPQPGFILSVSVKFCCGLVDLWDNVSQRSPITASLNALAPSFVCRVWLACSAWVAGRAWFVFRPSTIHLLARTQPWLNFSANSLSRLPQCNFVEVVCAICRENDRGVLAEGGVREPDLWPLNLIPQNPQKAIARHGPQSEEEGVAEGGLRHSCSEDILPLGSGTPAFWIMPFISSRCALKNASTMIGRASQQLLVHHCLPGSSNLSLWKPRVNWRGPMLAQAVEALHPILTPALQNSLAARWWRNQMANSSRLQWRRHPALTPKLAAWTFGGMTAGRWDESVLYMSVLLPSLLCFFLSWLLACESVMIMSNSVCNGSVALLFQ